jgi:hypothetical protein
MTLRVVLRREARADYFCTCDDRLLRKAKALDGLGTTAVAPTELVMELDK